MNEYTALQIGNPEEQLNLSKSLKGGIHKQYELENISNQDQKKSKSNNEQDNSSSDHMYSNSNKNARITKFFLKSIYVRRFVNKLQENKQMYQQLKLSHLNFINDLASDNCIIQKQISQIEQYSYFNKSFVGHRQFANISNKLEDALMDVRRLLMKFLLNIELIYPESKKKYYWDHLALIFRIILLYIVPLEICYEINILYTNIWLSTSIILVILFDLLIRLNTVCFINGTVITDRIDIIVCQIKKQFFGDILTIILLLFNLIFNPSFKFFLVLVLYQYINIYYFSQRTEQTMYLSKYQKGLLNIFKLVARSIMILHVFSCLWFYISKLNKQQSWIISKGLDLEELQLCYLESFYFGIVTLLTIGYGDNVPQNPIEKIFMIVFLLFACLWFSYSINFIGNTITELTLKQTETNQKLGILNSYFRRRDIPIQLQHKYLQMLNRIIEYLLYRWKEDDDMDLHVESEILGQLPETLKFEIKMLNLKQIISQSKFMTQNFSEKFNLKLVNYIQKKIINPCDTFSIQIDNQMCLCFIEDGQVVFNSSGRLKGRIDFRKSNGLLCLQDFICDNPELKQFKALGQVSIIYITKNDFIQCLKEFPEDFQTYCQIRDQFYQTGKEIKNAAFCPLCMNDDHTIKQCKFVFYTPEKEGIIKKFCFPKYQRRMKFKRKIKSFNMNAREQLKLLSNCYQLVQQDNIHNIECLNYMQNLISESQSLIQNNEIDQSDGYSDQNKIDQQQQQLKEKFNVIKQYGLYYKELNQIEIFYAFMINKQIPQFENIQIFPQYFPKNNFGLKVSIDAWQKNKVQSLLPYCFYPQQFISQYLLRRRIIVKKEQQICASKKSQNYWQQNNRRKQQKKLTIQQYQILPLQK